MVTEKDIIDAWVHLRKTNCSISDEALDFIKFASLEKLAQIQAKDEVEQDAQIIAKKFGVKAMQEINAMCVDAPIDIDMLADFVRYRIEVKKPLKTIRPLKQFAQELIAIETAGYSAKDAIEVMKNAEWQTIKLAWIKKTLSTKQSGADLAQFGFGANNTQGLLNG